MPVKVAVVPGGGKAETADDEREFARGPIVSRPRARGLERNDKNNRTKTTGKT